MNTQEPRLHLATDIDHVLRQSSWNGRLMSAPAVRASRLRVVYTRTSTDYLESRYQVVEFGSRFGSARRPCGVAYGWVFRRMGCAPAPNSAVFYDLCDSIDSDTAAMARQLIDSGRFTELFERGDLLAIGALDFRSNVPAAERVRLIRDSAVALQRKFPRIRSAAIMVHPWEIGAVEICARSEVVGAYRRALQKWVAFAARLEIGKLLGSPCAHDVIVERRRDVGAGEEMAELLLRTHL